MVLVSTDFGNANNYFVIPCRYITDLGIKTTMPSYVPLQRHNEDNTYKSSHVKNTTTALITEILLDTLILIVALIFVFGAITSLLGQHWSYVTGLYVGTYIRQFAPHCALCTAAGSLRVCDTV